MITLVLVLRYSIEKRSIMLATAKYGLQVVVKSVLHYVYTREDQAERLNSPYTVGLVSN